MATVPARAASLMLHMADWMLVPMVIVWPTMVLGTYFVATSLTDQPFDRELATLVLAVAEEARRETADAPPESAFPAVNALLSVPGERALVQVRALPGGVLAGDVELPPDPGAERGPLDTVRFRDVRMDGEYLRIASLETRVGDGPRLRLVQVAEPLARRRTLASEATGVVMTVMIVLLPAMVALVWFGLYRGLLPLRELSARLRARDASDTSPIPSDDVPEELAPLVRGLNGQLERVRANLESQRRFVDDAAHQLRTPLAGLKGQAQMALREWPAPGVRERLVRIEKNSSRLAHLVTRLLELARVDEMRMRGEVFRDVDLDALLREVCGQCAELALARGSLIAFEPSGGPARVRGSPLLLRELFSNLVDNAIRFTPAGGEVIVRVRAGGVTEVVVDDQGPGIPEEERKRVFDRFYRGIDAVGFGSGLGLAIVKEIAERHDATVRIERSTTGGSRFVVAFPGATRQATRRPTP